MNMKHHDAVLPIRIRNLSGFLVQLVSYLSLMKLSNGCVSVYPVCQQWLGKRRMLGRETSTF